MRTTRAGLRGTTPTTTARSCRGPSRATLNGASIYIESLRNPDQYKTEKGAQLKTDILHAPLPKGPAGQFSMHTYHSHCCRRYSKNQEAAKDFLKWMHTKADLREVVHLAEGLRHAADRRVGEAQGVERGSGHGALQGRRPARPHARLRGPGRTRRPPRCSPSTSSPTCTRRLPGHAARGRREVGRGRTEEGLRLTRAPVAVAVRTGHAGFEWSRRLRRATARSETFRHPRGADTRDRARRAIELKAETMAIAETQVYMPQAPRPSTAARGRALARLRAAGADPGAARPVHRLSVRRGHLAVGDRHARRRARRIRRAREFRTRSGTTHLPHVGLQHRSSIRA